MSSELQFDRAEFTETPVRACGSCKAPLSTEYFAVDSQTLCGNCAAQVRTLFAGEGLGAGRFLKAVLLGIGAAVAGAAVYAAIMIFANSEWALISIAVGWFVGAAVRRGSAGRGGWRYQLLAAFLTYTAICAANGAAVWSQAAADERSVRLLVAVVINAYAIPFLEGAQNIIGLLIIGFGVWRAWQMNRPVRVEITGPHAIVPAPNPQSLPDAAP